MKKIIGLTTLSLALALVALLAYNAQAQVPTGTSGVPVSQFVSADDGGIAILVKYIGTSTSATVQVAQGAGITFQAAGVADTTFECPVSGALGGIIDTSNAACNTLGEVVDIINSSTSDFRAVIVDGLRSDTSAKLLTAGATQATVAEGYALYQDTSANFAVGETRALVPGSCRTDIRCFMTPQGKLLQNPFGGTKTILSWVEGYSTYGGGTSVLNIYSVKPNQKAAGAETVTQLWSEAMGATATNKQFTQFQYAPLVSRPDEKMIVRISNDTAQASVRLLAAGRQVPR